MKIKVVSVSSASLWYADSVGTIYTVIRCYEDEGVYLVRDNENYLNIIREIDCVVVEGKE